MLRRDEAFTAIRRIGVGMLTAGLLALGGCSILMLPIRAVLWVVDGFIEYFPLFALFAPAAPVDLPAPALEADAAWVAPMDATARALPGEGTLYLVDSDWAPACLPTQPLGRSLAERHEYLLELGWQDAAQLANDRLAAHHLIDDLERRGITIAAIGPTAQAFLDHSRSTR
ncbi:MAG: hypothetical protein RL885_23580 [Planctomycetota bacterium]